MFKKKIQKNIYLYQPVMKNSILVWGIIIHNTTAAVIIVGNRCWSSFNKNFKIQLVLSLIPDRWLTLIIFSFICFKSKKSKLKPNIF